MVKFIVNEMDSLRNEINQMWTWVYNQMDIASDAVLTMNAEQAQQVMVREKRINAFELNIDAKVEDIIALYNPVAVDLRFVLATLKINSNLERIGDFAEGIARFVRDNENMKPDADLIIKLRLEEMFEQVLNMLLITKEAFNEESIEKATSIFEKDNLLDEINANVTTILTEHIMVNPDDTKVCLELIGVFRKLERTGDHMTNIAEEIIFFIDAKVLKHHDKISDFSNFRKKDSNNL